MPACWVQRWRKVPRDWISEAKPSPLTSWGTEPSTNRQVTSVPGATSMAGGRNLRSLASTVVTPRTGGASAGEAAEPLWQATNVNTSTSRSGTRGRGRVGNGAPCPEASAGAERQRDQEDPADDQEGGQGELDDGDDPGRLGHL